MGCQVSSSDASEMAVKKKLQVIVLPEPFGLRGKVPVQDVTFRVLETPRDDNKDVPFPDPCPFLDLALDPAHPVNAIGALYTDVVCPHHEPGAGKLLAVLPFWQPHPDYRGAVCVEFSNS